MKQFQINQLSKGGLNTDLDVSELAPNIITDGRNFRSEGNSIKNATRPQVLDTTVDFNAGFVLPVRGSTGDNFLIAGDNSVFAYDGSAYTDISSLAGYAFPPGGELDWTAAVLGSIPIINNLNGAPEYWSPAGPGQVLQPLLFSPGNTWDSLNKSCNVIRSHKNFLFALGLTEGGVSLPNSYRWSHPADQNGLPFTWDETDLSAIASIEQISGSSGRIVDGLSLRDNFMIYSEVGINSLTHVGGEFVFRNNELSSTFGVLSANLIQEVDGSHFFLSDGDILINNGNQIKSLTYNRIRSRLTARANGEFYHRSFSVHNIHRKEVWFCVVEDSAEYPNIAYVYNYEDDAWGLRDIGELTHGAYGNLPSAAIQDWNAQTTSWESSNNTWGSNIITPLNREMIGIDSNNSDIQLIDVAVTPSNEDTNSRIERTNFLLGDHIGVTTILSAYPHILGSGQIEISIGSQQYLGGSVTWEQPVVFNIGIDQKIDVRTTGELHSWRIDTIGSANYSISGMTLQYAEAGFR